MLCRVKRGVNAVYGKGKSVIRIKRGGPNEYFNTFADVDDGKCPDWAEPVKGKTGPKQKAAGHLGNELKAPSQVSKDNDKNVPVRQLLPMIEDAQSLEALEGLIKDDEDRKTVLEAYEKRKAELSEGSEDDTGPENTEGAASEE